MLYKKGDLLPNARDFRIKRQRKANLRVSYNLGMIAESTPAASVARTVYFTVPRRRPLWRPVCLACHEVPLGAVGPAPMAT